MRGRSTYQSDMEKLRVYMNPRVYRMRDLELNITRATNATRQQSELKNYLNIVPNFFKTIPYASAKLFYNIVTAGFKQTAGESQVKNLAGSYQERGKLSVVLFLILFWNCRLEQVLR